MTKGVKITGTIVPANEQDDYSTNIDNFGKGGIHSVSTLIDRDAITLLRRSVGMLCYVQEDNSVYILTTGIANSDWKKLYYVENDKVIFHINLLKNYILLGGSDDIAYQSLSFKDAKQDIIDLRKLIDKDVHETKDNRRKLDDISNAHYILQSKLDIEDPDGSFPNAQYLKDLSGLPGILFSNISGVVSTVALQAGTNITIDSTTEPGKYIINSTGGASSNLLPFVCGLSSGYTVTTNYTITPNTVDHVKFNSVIVPSAYGVPAQHPLIALFTTAPYSTLATDFSVGQIWLELGHVYKLEASLNGIQLPNNNPYGATFTWSLIIYNTALGNYTETICSPANAAHAESYNNTFNAYFVTDKSCTGYVDLRQEFPPNTIARVKLRVISSYTSGTSIMFKAGYNPMDKNFFYSGISCTITAII